MGLTHGRWSVRAIQAVAASLVAVASAQTATVIRSPLAQAATIASQAEAGEVDASLVIFCVDPDGGSIDAGSGCAPLDMRRDYRLRGTGIASAGAISRRISGYGPSRPSEPPGAEPCPDRRYDGGFVLIGTRRADRIRGGRHGELVLAGGGADRVFAGGGNDCVDGGPGRDRLSGGSGDDVLAGGTGHDALSGGTNDDVLMGDSGPDVLSGGAGDDLLIAGPGHDRLDCGSGRRDVARVERGDSVRRCERIVRAR